MSLLSQEQLSTILKASAAIGIGYILVRGNSLINRPIHAGKKHLNVDDTRGKPVIDKEWSYKSRDHSANNFELTFTPVRPLSPSILKNQTKTQINTDSVDVIIIGGAAAGLASAACCEKEGLSYIVFEKNENVGDVWLSRYHRLHLHDIIDNCHLPYMDMPTSYPVFPSRKEFADYLEGYKKILNLKVKTCTVVQNAERIDQNDPNSGWSVKVQNLSQKSNNISTYKCKHLIMASGVFGDAKIPTDIPGSDKYAGLIVHSSQYTNGSDLGLDGKKVLIVGWGNSGSEIALDLCEHGAKPTLLIRSGQVVVPHHIMRFVEEYPKTHLMPFIKYVPFGWLSIIPIFLFQDIIIKILCRIHYGNLSKYGIIIHKDGVFKRFLKDGIAPLMDIGTVSAIKDGSIKVIKSEIKEYDENNNVTFQNNVKENFDCIVYATGYSIFTSHRHWMNKEDLKLIGVGKDALDKHKILPGSNFKKLPTLWYCFGNLIMIKLAAHSQASKIRNAIKNDNKNKIWWIKFLSKQIIKHIIALILMRKLWIWWKT